MIRFDVLLVNSVRMRVRLVFTRREIEMKKAALVSVIRVYKLASP